MDRGVMEVRHYCQLKFYLPLASLGDLTTFLSSLLRTDRNRFDYGLTRQDIRREKKNEDLKIKN